MRALVVREWTQFKNLKIEDNWPRPAIEADAVRIRTRAAGVNFALSLRVEGKYQIKPELPHVPGNELCGEIIEVGPNVTELQVGDRVASNVAHGAYAEECIAPVHRTFKLPDSVPFHEAVGLTTSFMTSYIALVWPQWINLRFGQTILIHGAAGGVGLAAIDIAKVLGATVFATCSSTEKAEVCRQHGADHVIDYQTTDFRTRVLELTDGRGVDAVYDPVGGEVFSQSLRCIAPEGCIMPIGFSSGVIPQIPANILLVKNIRVLGLNNGYYNGQWGNDPKRHRDMGKVFEPQTRAAMNQILRWVEQGRVKLDVTQVFPFERCWDAMEIVLSRKAIGRVAVVFD